MIFSTSPHFCDPYNDFGETQIVAEMLARVKIYVAMAEDITELTIYVIVLILSKSRTAF